MQIASPPSIYLVTTNDSTLVTPDRSFHQHFIKHNIDTGRARISESPESADLVILFQEWSFKTEAYIAQLEADLIVKKYAEKLYVVNYDSTVSEGFLPGCYVSLKNSHYQPNRFRTCAYPKTYNEYLDDIDREQPIKYLFSFRGTLHSHEVRPRMFAALEHAPNSLMVDNTKAFHSHTAKEKTEYLEELSQSLFVLCPRGISPNSYRLFEAMSLGRCPVIISDEWVDTEGPNWSQCSIRVAENQVHFINDILKERESDGAELGQYALEEWQKHFTEAATYQNYLDQITRLTQNANPVTMPFTEYQRYWHSHQFLSANNWALNQKVVRKLKQFLPL